LACLLSHVSLWKKVVDKKIPAIAIFEDDIYLGENAELLLKDLSWLSVDIVKIEKISNTAILDLASLDIFDDENSH
jgi:glycosyl transferase family 25